VAPEVITNQRPTQKSDIWSLGCTVIELLTGDPPYYELNQMQASYNMVENEHPPLPDKISKLCEDFLLLCFKKDLTMRKDASELLNHAWVKPFRETQTSSTNSQVFTDKEQEPQLKSKIVQDFEEDIETTTSSQVSPRDEKHDKTPLLKLKGNLKEMETKMEDLQVPPGSPMVRFPEGYFKRGVNGDNSIRNKAALTSVSGEKSIKIIEKFQDGEEDDKFSMFSPGKRGSDLFQLNLDTEKRVNVNQIKDTRFNNILHESSGRNLTKFLEEEEDENYSSMFDKIDLGKTLRVKLNRFKNVHWFLFNEIFRMKSILTTMKITFRLHLRKLL
jgi:serine/threonine protein kinase